MFCWNTTEKRKLEKRKVFLGAQTGIPVFHMA